MEHSRETIAMLIDADNSPSDKIDFILSEMAKYGVVNIRRAYGNWKSHSLKGWENKLHDYAIRPIQQFDYTKGKNATDMAMTIDAMDLLYSKKLDAFCIVSSDSDFTPLVMRILSEGLNVYGFGQKSAPAPFVNACSTFLYVESFGGGQEKSRNDGGRRRSGQQLKSDSKLLNLLRNAVDSVEEEDGWSNLAKIGKHISNQASFDPRNYGFKRLSDLIRSIDLFEIEFRNNNSELYIREKSKARKSDGGSSEVAAMSEPVASEADAETLGMLTAPSSCPASPSEAFTQQSVAPKGTVSEPVSVRSAEAKADASKSTSETKPAMPEPVVPKLEALEPVVELEPVKPVDTQAADPASVAAAKPVELEASASETVAAGSASEPSSLTEAKPKRATRSRTTKPRSTSTRKTKTTTAEKESEPPKAAEEVSVAVSEPAEPEATQSSAETPEPEKKPKRTTRRRTTRKKSEPESASAPAEPEG